MHGGIGDVAIKAHLGLGCWDDALQTARGCLAWAHLSGLDTSRARYRVAAVLRLTRGPRCLATDRSLPGPAQAEDVFYLSFAELHAAVASGWADRELIAQRREAFHSYQALTPPRVITSDGEVVTGHVAQQRLPR